MIATYRYRIYPTRAQERTLKQMQFAVFKLYNDSLRARREVYEAYEETLSTFEMARVWTHICNEWRDCPVRILPNDTRTQVLKRIDRAYDAYFKNIKAWKAGEWKSKKVPKPPWFKRLDDTTSIPFRGRNLERFREYHLPGDAPCVYLQGLGEVKTVYHRPLPSNLQRITWATVNEAYPDQWYVSLTCEFEARDLPEMFDGAIGIDVGLTCAIAGSEGTLIPAPGFLKDSLSELRRLQRHLDRQRRANNPQNYNDDGTIKKGPKQWHKSGRMKQTEDRIRKLHAKVSEQRKHFWHNLTNELTRHYHIICLEDLSLAFMQKNKRLSRDVADVSIGMFWQQLKTKGVERGCMLVWVDPAYTSQTCAECGHVAKDNRKTQAVFKCVECGHTDNADVNAARNILARGLSQIDAQTDDTQAS